MPRKYCPPNTFCFDEDNIFNLLLIFLIAGFVLYYLYNRTNIPEKKVDIREKENIIINVDTDSRDLLEEPGRKYFNKGVPINIRTRGEPAKYDQIGFLTSVSDPSNIKPLFGRQTYPGSPQYEYYYRGRDAGGLEFKFPLPTQNGKEIYDNEVLTLPTDNNNFTVKIYPNDLPRYNPIVD